MLSKFDSLILYLTIYLFSAICISNSKKKKRGASKALYLLGIIGPIILAAFRYQVGTDYYNYHLMYNSYALMSAQQYFTSRELLYGWGVWFISKISLVLGGERSFFGAFAFLILYFGLKGFERFTNVNWFLIVYAFLLGPFSVGLNTMKQAAALAIIFWGLKFVYEKNIVKYILSVLLAVMLHTSALIAVPIYFIYHSDEDKIWNFRSVIAVFIAIVASANVMNILLAISKIDFMNISRFSSYSTGGTGNLSFFLLLFEFLLIILHQKKLAIIDEKNKLLIVLMGLGLSLNAIGFISVYVKRVSSYFTAYSLLVLFSQLGKAVPQYRYNKRITETFLCLFFITVFILYYYFRGQGDIIPYQFQL